MKIKPLICLILTAHAQAALAGSVAGFGGSTEVTQIMNNAQLIEQTNEMVDQTTRLKAQLQRQTDMLSDMKKNGQTISNQEWGRTSSDLKELARVVEQGEAIAYTSANLDELYRQKYEGYDEFSRKSVGPSTYSDLYSEWSKTNQDSVIGAMKAANLQENQFSNEVSTMQTIENMGRTSKGRMEAIQVGNMIAAQQVGQLQKLRSLFMAQMQMQSAFMTFEANQKDAANAKSHNFFKSQLSNIDVNDGESF